jgi:outer membrane protein assembly factor BamD (BamD/ComL family)
LRATPTPAPPERVDESAARDQSSTLLQEVASLDAARRALARGNAANAVSLLVAHETRFPSGTLTPEARVLRIRALLAAGRRDEAEKLASQFLAANPGSPHAARIRSLLSAR